MATLVTDPFSNMSGSRRVFRLRSTTAAHHYQPGTTEGYEAMVRALLGVCPECGAEALTDPDPGCVPVCLACDWTGWDENGE